MTVSDLLSALVGTTRVDLTVGQNTYRVESNESAILNSTTLALSVSTVKLALDGKTPYLEVTTAE